MHLCRVFSLSAAFVEASAQPSLLKDKRKILLTVSLGGTIIIAAAPRPRSHEKGVGSRNKERTSLLGCNRKPTMFAERRRTFLTKGSSSVGLRV